jgi:hypothetical protein
MQDCQLYSNGAYADYKICIFNIKVGYTIFFLV